MNTGQLETVAVWIEAAERAPAREQGAGAVEAGIASLREIHHYMAGDVSGAVEAGRRSVERAIPPGGRWVARCSASPSFGVGSPTRRRALEESVNAAREADNHLAVIHASAGRAVIAAEGEDLEEAGHRARPST